MFAAGVPLVEALESVSGATGNVVYQDAVLKMREEVATGQALQLSMRQRNLFPHMVIQMTAIGEESGALDEMLAKVADFYEEQVDNAVDGLSSLLEPLIMVVIGVWSGAWWWPCTCRSSSSPQSFELSGARQRRVHKRSTGSSRATPIDRIY